MALLELANHFKKSRFIGYLANKRLSELTIWQPFSYGAFALQNQLIAWLAGTDA
jgi:hypothetical protein